VDYALRVIEGSGDPAPDALVLVAPAIGVSPVAALAVVQRLVSTLPGLEKLAWTDILPEFDPYKYNSFPARAAEQIYALTESLAERLERADAEGRLSDFPPVLAFHSVVDATIPPGAVVERLLGRLPVGRAQLVLFDVNRLARARPFLRTGHEALLESLVDAPALPFALTVVGNTPAGLEVSARTRLAGESTWTQEPLGLSWPAGVYSLSHVALPFRPDDPVYGAREAMRDPDALPLGALELRGERGVFGISMDQLMRLRHNPFFAYVEARIASFVAAPESAPH
jgi:alpha-beta hydrolase superfamily lysophospholipase